MQTKDQHATMMDAPRETPELRLGNWSPVPDSDPLAGYLTDELWQETGLPKSWEFARRSQAVYVYRETVSGWQVTAKFYRAKTGEKAEKYATRELSLIEQARRASLTTGPVRAIRPYTVWRGVLFMEYVEGLTLEDVIAVRRSRPGSVSDSLAHVAQLLGRLHGENMAPPHTPNMVDAGAEARGIVANLSRYGVLKENRTVQEGLLRQIRRWEEEVNLRGYRPALTHGDATTTNFIFADQAQELVAIDWERSRIADPAADIGRIAAEVAHSVGQHGGNSDEARSLIDYFKQAYAEFAFERGDIEGLLERARYYQAITSLRIARNGWLSRLDRVQLVAEAMALLA